MKFTTAFLMLISYPIKSVLGDICLGDCVTSETGEKTCTFTSVIDYAASELGKIYHDSKKVTIDSLQDRSSRLSHTKPLQNKMSFEKGYFTFKECGEGKFMPTIGLEKNVNYIFDQTDLSNHYHPIGFAYYADGAHDDQDELEPGILPPGSTSGCDEDATCPAPMYFVSDKYVGSYSNNPATGVNKTTNDENFGLDDYEPLFFHPLLDWVGYGSWKVYLKFDDESAVQDMFYFCHIHQYMSGRMKLVDNTGAPLQSENIPALEYDYDVPSEFDKECGTYNTHPYTLPHPMCPPKYVCDVPETNRALQQFSTCIEAMDCAMSVRMTNHVRSESEVALFIHQMIPHHQNAVNMAKALMKTGNLSCDDITDDENPDCVMEEILRSIINNQNFQIQQMRGVLDSKAYKTEEEELCVWNPEDYAAPVTLPADENGSHSGSASGDAAGASSSDDSSGSSSVAVSATFTGVVVAIASLFV